ncbi:MAG: serine hydrolase [Cyclobacteriaceae bacterium]|nr:MAG: serine hydrolase [Cyclobacteriaceae bacterium]
MKNFLILPIVLIVISSYLKAQELSDQSYADSIIKANQIPGLSYAVFTSDSILSIGSTGVKKYGSPDQLSINHIMALGSCTKSVTGLIAAKLVDERLIKWDTDFYSLYPELKIKKPPFDKLTFLNLLSHRAEVPPLTGQNKEKMPDITLLTDTTMHSRIRLAKWILNQKKVPLVKTYNYSNGGYLLAALMMEKVTGLTWETLVHNYMAEEGIVTYFKFPNELDINNVWLHDERVYPVAPEANDEAGVRKPLAAGGLVFMPFIDAVKYVQLNMRGGNGDSQFLPKEKFRFVHCGLPEYALGWGCKQVNNTDVILHRGNIGGRSWCLFQFIPAENIGIVIMTNTGDAQTGVAINHMRDHFITKYINRTK